jgi:signal transduction histidine kinase
MKRFPTGVPLGTQLLVLLLAFGAIPVAATSVVGYMVSRAVILGQAEAALRELGRQQAVHLATELTRERLILRTITGRLPGAEVATAMSSDALASYLAQSLPEDGVFDGLRVVQADGRVLTSVALRNTAPDWPERAPAAVWTEEQVALHWDNDRPVAYLLAVPVEGTQTVWLEGHVRSEEFLRLFSMPEHLMGNVETAVFDVSGRAILVSHEHAEPDIAAAVCCSAPDVATTMRALVSGVRSVIVSTSVAETDWTFAAALPIRTALAPLAGLRNAALLAASVLVVLIFATAVFATKSISTPLRELAGVARDFGHGEPFRPLQASGAAEVRLLVDAFDQMATDLQQSRAEITRLHEQDMERAQQLATVGEMASGIAHEIRNPLTGVLGAVELALKGLPVEDAARGLLEEAQQQLRRIEGTTSQLLRYARPPQLRDVVVDPNNVVERAARVVEPHAKAAGVEVLVKPAEVTVAVRADPELTVQVLVNLMLNGIDAMGEGGKLTVVLEPQPPELRIVVRDGGPGVPEEIKREIFRPFFTTKHQGTGLGLPISRQIVARHGGRMWVEDSPGGGATFVVALPLVRKEDGTP